MDTVHAATGDQACAHHCLYHPIANGLVERLHRHMKSALKAELHPERWTEALPFVLLGIRMALKEDLHCMAAELVYGCSLRLPGEFFTPNTGADDDMFQD